MTSEVLLMNRNAIVLAADSALTYSAYGEDSIHAPGVDKIFTISDAATVAAMFYNVASYYSLTWDVVFDEFIKDYKDVGDVYSINEWYERLIDYLKDIPNKRQFGVTEADEVRNFQIYIGAFVRHFCELLKRSGWDPDERPTEQQLESALAKYRRQIEMTAIEDGDGKLVVVARQRSVPSDRLSAFFRANVWDCLISELEDWFGDVGFPEETLDPLAELLFTSTLVDWVPRSLLGARTGLILAGYGHGETLPRAICAEFVPGFAGVLKFIRRDHLTLDPETNGGVVIETFAQDELIHSWLNGMERNVEYGFVSELGEFLEYIKNQILSEDINLKAPQAAQIEAIFDSAMDQRPDVVFWAKKSFGSGFANREKLSLLVHMSNDRMLVDIATKIMTMTLLGKELVNEHSVSRPLNILAMKRGQKIPHVIP